MIFSCVMRLQKGGDSIAEGSSYDYIILRDFETKAKQKGSYDAAAEE
jgi:hypothetical protein